MLTDFFSSIYLTDRTLISIYCSLLVSNQVKPDFEIQN